MEVTKWYDWVGIRIELCMMLLHVYAAGCFTYESTHQRMHAKNDCTPWCCHIRTTLAGWLAGCRRCLTTMNYQIAHWCEEQQLRKAKKKNAKSNSDKDDEDVSHLQCLTKWWLVSILAAWLGYCCCRVHNCSSRCIVLWRLFRNRWRWEACINQSQWTCII